jgi:hypothetical protein
MNYRLYIVKDEAMSASCVPSEALWVSRDYNPDTRDNWHEDLEWSADSSIIAVIIDGQYSYANNFNSNEKINDPASIQYLLESHNSP